MASYSTLVGHNNSKLLINSSSNNGGHNSFNTPAKDRVTSKIKVR